MSSVVTKVFWALGSYPYSEKEVPEKVVHRAEAVRKMQLLKDKPSPKLPRTAPLSYLWLLLRAISRPFCHLSTTEWAFLEPAKLLCWAVV